MSEGQVNLQPIHTPNIPFSLDLLVASTLPQRIFKAHRSADTVGGNRERWLLQSFTVAVGTVAIAAIDDGYDRNCSLHGRRGISNTIFAVPAHAGDACGTHVHTRAHVTQDKGRTRGELPRELKFIESVGVATRIAGRERSSAVDS